MLSRAEHTDVCVRECVCVGMLDCPLSSHDLCIGVLFFFFYPFAG